MVSQSYNVTASQLSDKENKHSMASGSFRQPEAQPHVILSNQFPHSNLVDLSQQFQPHFGLNHVVAPYTLSAEQLYGNGCSFQDLLNVPSFNPNPQTSVSSDLLNVPSFNPNPQTSVSSKRAKKSNNGSNRRWTVDEDTALAKSYLYITMDAIVGKDQTSQTMWDRIFKSWKDIMGKYDEVRNAKALQCRWGTIQGAVNKFHGIHEALDRAPQSGTTIQDMVKSAMRIYEETGDGSSFKFIHCWEVLKSSPKWCSQMLAKINTLKKTKLTDDSVTSSPPLMPNASTFVAANGNDLNDLDAHENEACDDVNVVIRPQGRKGSKEKKRRLTEQKEMENGFNSLQCTLEKQFALQQKNMEAREILLKKEMELRERNQELKKEAQKLKEQAEKRKELAEKRKEKVEKRKDQERIMNTDLNNLQPMLRTAFEKMQAQIMKEWEAGGLFGDVTDLN